MAMKPRAMKSRAKKMMRGGMADKPMDMKDGGKAKRMRGGGMAKMPISPLPTPKPGGLGRDRIASPPAVPKRPTPPLTRR